MELSSALLREQAYLVANGVRALALVDSCAAEPTTMSRVMTQLESAGGRGVTPFVLDRGDGFADFGYASGPWALDLLQWTTRADSGVPLRQKHRIRGLLLGYSAEAIRAFEERSAGRLFESAVAGDD